MSRNDPIPDPIDAWLRSAIDDAERRGLPELRPLLEGLALSTARLRAADWNDRVPPVPPPPDGDAR
jgi:hypothetical protein